MKLSYNNIEHFGGVFGKGSDEKKEEKKENNKKLLDKINNLETFQFLE